MVLHNMTRFELIYAISGGILVGIGLSLAFILFGQVFGTSSVMQSLFSLKFNDQHSRKYTILAAIIFASALLQDLYREHTISAWFFDNKKFISNLDPSLLIISGFLVGFGSAIGKGGLFTHGLCGLPRFSRRSIIAVILFSLSAYYTNDAKLNLTLSQLNLWKYDINLPQNFSYSVYVLLSLLAPFCCFIFSEKKSLKKMVQYLILFLCGLLIGSGLMIGGLTELSDYLFLFKFEKFWDPTLLVLFGTAILINFVTYNYMICSKKSPLFSPQINLSSDSLDIGIILGPIIFGVGWGLTGISPVSMFLFVPFKNTKIIFYSGISCLIGLKIGGFLTNIFTRKQKEK